MSRRYSNKTFSKPKNSEYHGSKQSKNSHSLAVSQVRIIGGRFKRQLIPFIAADGLRPSPDRLRETLFNWVQFDIFDARVLDLCAGSGVLGFEALSRGASHTTFIELHPKQATLLQQTSEKLKLEPQCLEIHCGDALKIIPKLAIQDDNTNANHSNRLTSKPSSAVKSSYSLDSNNNTLNSNHDSLSSNNSILSPIHTAESINAPNTENVNNIEVVTKNIQQKYYQLVFVDPPYDLALWVPLLETLLKCQLVNSDTLFYIEDRKPLSETLAGLNTLYDFIVIKETHIGQIYASLINIQPRL